MTDWRAPLVFLLLAMAMGLSALPASAQPSAPDAGAQPEAVPEAEPEPQPDPEAQSSSQPQSPEEEAALRRARLDTLFARLAQKDSPDWESVQNDIWIQWSQSGSPSIDLLLFRAGRAMESGDHELALRFLNDVVRLAPAFAEGWNKRATVYFLLEEYGHSIADIERTLALAGAAGRPERRDAGLPERAGDSPQPAGRGRERQASVAGCGRAGIIGQ
jgi:tetratricopeptide (TPR) repeat protein